MTQVTEHTISSTLFPINPSHTRIVVLGNKLNHYKKCTGEDIGQPAGTTHCFNILCGPIIRIDSNFFSSHTFDINTWKLCTEKFDEIGRYFRTYGTSREKQRIMFAEYFILFRTAYGAKAVVINKCKETGVVTEGNELSENKSKYSRLSIAMQLSTFKKLQHL